MKDSKLLNIDEFFYQLKDEIYCIVKMDPKFPNYLKGEDIDIFCYDIKKVVKKILEVGNKYVERGFDIKVTDVENQSQAYVDFYYDGKLELRFDLYGKLPEYKNILIKVSLFSSVIENSITKTRQYNEKSYNIFVPSKIDDLLLRYIEYIEWYRVRPDKIKHIDYIFDNLDESTERITLFDKLHYYTEIPESYRREDVFYGVKGFTYYRNLVGILFKRAKTKRVSELPRALYKFLKN